MLDDVLETLLHQVCYTMIGKLGPWVEVEKSDPNLLGLSERAISPQFRIEDEIDSFLKMLLCKKPKTLDNDQNNCKPNTISHQCNLLSLSDRHRFFLVDPPDQDPSPLFPPKDINRTSSQNFVV